MTANVGNVDRIIRVVAGTALVALHGLLHLLESSNTRDILCCSLDGW